MKPKDVFTFVFQAIVTAAALKAALTTLSRPMAGTPYQPMTGRAGRMGSVPVEGFEDDSDDDDLDLLELL